MKPKRQDKKQATRQKILASAYHLFTQKGYDNTSYTEIAKHAELGYGTIYIYFKTKEDLLVALSSFNLDMRLKQLNDATKSIENPLERALEFVDKMWAYDAEIPLRSLETFYGHRWRLSQDDHKELLAKMNLFIDLVDSHLEEAQSMGLLSKDLDISLSVHLLSSSYYRALQDGRFNDAARKKAKETLDKQTRYVLRLGEN